MNGITEKKTEKYLTSLLPRRDAVLREMERYAAQHDVPIVGPACGRLLHQLARMIHARRVFEMGSAIGYDPKTSTLHTPLALGHTVQHHRINFTQALRAADTMS